MRLGIAMSNTRIKIFCVVPDCSCSSRINSQDMPSKTKDYPYLVCLAHDCNGNQEETMVKR